MGIDPFLPSSFMNIAKLYAAALGAPPDVPLQAPLAAARPPPRSLGGKAKAAARHAAGSAMQAVKSLSGKNLLANMKATKSGRTTCNWGNPEHGAAELEPLLAFTTLVDIRWLARFAAQEDGDLKPIPSWQALPPEAVVQKAQLEAYTGIGLPDSRTELPLVGPAPSRSLSAASEDVAAAARTPSSRTATRRVAKVAPLVFSGILWRCRRRVEVEATTRSPHHPTRHRRCSHARADRAISQGAR